MQCEYDTNNIKLGGQSYLRSWSLIYFLGGHIFLKYYSLVKKIKLSDSVQGYYIDVVMNGKQRAGQE